MSGSAVRTRGIVVFGSSQPTTNWLAAIGNGLAVNIAKSVAAVTSHPALAMTLLPPVPEATKAGENLKRYVNGMRRSRAVCGTAAAR
jgi:hypothetical protein